ncbi:Di-copper centre-containing protein [Aaosphaeria arxii CBS 175.79]|uniref:tyrosinase n=1 Tax=Aaosphaeria arxii CBS 175.79 TaxID=1450172 RepID=A0A6A5XFW1_9PLEO|nr:Di-copper centre-containing protein [Aaosphaeria arxii CBS 175.79]KAF2012125.1 Di-copper centre-containing protein [Aaosphaeria arxii CBS 175.79]
MSPITTVTTVAKHILFTSLLISPSSLASPVGFTDGSVSDEALRTLEERQQSVIVTLGAANFGDNNAHPRLEVRELERNTDQWNLFLLGLRRFQNTDQRDKLSYYQISGIHGRPYVTWDGVGQGQGASGGGYCPHGSNLFTTWHRPYLALFEQILYLNARQVISELDDGDVKDGYETALTTLRLPYWDWAAVPPDGEGSFPLSAQRRTVTVALPNGTATFDNPLLTYRFHPLVREDFASAPWTTYTQTVRNPSSSSGNAASRNDLVAMDLDDNRRNMQSRVYDMLSLEHDFTSISNYLQPGDSFESLHDTIHNTVGGGGHMSEIAMAAFDPIFWLHHANVDRLFAIWEALNPNSYVRGMENTFATWTYPGGSFADANTALTPFRKDDQGNFWSSSDVRWITTLGYTYPEFNDLTDGAATLVSRVNSLYGPRATSQLGNFKARAVSVPLHTREDNKGVAGAAAFSYNRKYDLNIKARKFGFDGSITVYVFLGDAPSSGSDTWAKEPSFLGMAGILSQKGSSDKQQPNVDAHCVVPLTAALESKAHSKELSSFKEKDVEEYLKKNLKWRVISANGDQVSTKDVPGFQVSVAWQDIQPSNSTTEFPKLKGDYKTLKNSTGENL